MLSLPFVIWMVLGAGTSDPAAAKADQVGIPRQLWQATLPTATYVQIGPSGRGLLAVEERDNDEHGTPVAGRLYAIKLNDGKQAWEVPISPHGIMSWAADENHLFVVNYAESREGWMEAVSWTTGKTDWKLPAHW